MTGEYPWRGQDGEILNGVPDPVVVLAPNREIVAHNDAARELLGADPIGRDLALSLRHPLVLETADTVLSGGHPDPIDISLALHVRRDFTLHASALSSGAVLVLRDVTTIKSGEQTRADFVANVSHELRSPLASLVGFIETLRGAARDDAQAGARFLGIMESEAARMTRLIDDLLSLSKVEAKEYIRPSGTVDMGRLLATIADTLALRAKERAMSIRITCPDGAPPVVGDADELTMVFRNLLDNAINYGRQGTSINVGVSALARIPVAGVAGLVVTVNNQGGVIASDHLPRLTERFYRVDKGRSRTMGGTGLGLAIVKHIVNRHRGRLTAASSAGDGTTFSVFLPTVPSGK